MAQKTIGRNLTEGSILKQLFVFSLPIVLANIVQQLYSMVDLVVVGQYVGNIGTVGVTNGGEISDLMTPIAAAFSTAGQIYIAQLVGAGNQEKVKEAIGTLVGFMMAISLACLTATALFYSQILNWLNCPSEAFGQAASYMLITTVGMPAIFAYNAICGILRGLGESKKPLLFVVIAAIANIVMDLILVIGFRMEAAGTAIATVTAQFGTAIAAFLYLWRHREEIGFRMSFSDFRIRKTPLKIIVWIGIPQLIRVVMVNYSMLWIKSNINSYGLTASATNSVGDKINKFTNAFINGVDTAAATMVGQNLGARKIQRVKQTVWYTFAGCLIVASIASVLALLIPRQLFGIFTSDQKVIEFGVIYMQIMVVTFMLSAMAGSMQSIVTGAGFVTLGFALGIIDGVIGRIGISILFTRYTELGVLGYFWSGGLCKIIPFLVALLYFLSGKWQTRKLLDGKI
ncbi:MAG: MATE family efflux transporter [Lachnospiraceae bacterium]|nr:MATE family efflux transporter [Lachnospiraceae bacterium]